MKKYIKKIEGGVQITVAGERWYLFGDGEYYPSCTWIVSYYPKGIAFQKWLASKGWDESQAIKAVAGDKGSKVHKAIETLLDGKEVPMEAKYINPTTEKEEELTLEEYECLMSFVEWWRECQPTTIAKELVITNKEYGYAGTVDYVCEIAGERWVIDFKTSQNIWPEHRLQVSAYAHALKDAHQQIDKLGILQLGYRLNKKKYKFTEIEDCFGLFLATRQIWAEETKGQEPLKRNYPLSLKLQRGEPNEDVRKTTHRDKGTVRNTATAQAGQDTTGD